MLGDPGRSRKVPSPRSRVADPGDGREERSHEREADPEGETRRAVAHPDHVLAGGHGEMVGDPRAHIQGYIDHRLERERAILGALTAGPMAPAAIVKRVYTDVPEELHGLAERSVLAHLERLSAKGLARIEGDAWRLEPEAGFS